MRSVKKAILTIVCFIKRYKRYKTLVGKIIFCKYLTLNITLKNQAKHNSIFDFFHSQSIMCLKFKNKNVLTVANVFMPFFMPTKDLKYVIEFYFDFTCMLLLHKQYYV